MSAKMNVPELRFGEFSREWEEKKLGNLGKFQGGGTPDTTNEQYWNGSIPWISSSDLVDNDIKNIKINRFINEISINESATKLIPKGSILFVSRVGVGKLVVADRDLCTSQDFTNLTLKEDISKYIGYYFLANKTLLVRYSQGTSIKGFTTNDIKTLKLHLPSKPEQEKIASFLSSVDSKIEQLSKKKTLLEQYKKGVMQKIFSQTLRFKDDDGSEFPEWVEKKLGDIATFTKGKGISKDDITHNGDLECIRYGELYTEYHETINETVSKTNLKADDLVLSQHNDIIIPSSGETAIDIATASCVLKDNVALGGDLNIIRTSQNGIFLSYYFNNAKKYDIAKLSQGSSVIHLYSTHLKSLKINLPSLKEQTKIASFLSSLDKKIELTDKELNATKEFKKALLQKMFV